MHVEERVCVVVEVVVEAVADLVVVDDNVAAYKGFCEHVYEKMKEPVVLEERV